jgi:hypothetical protein
MGLELCLAGQSLIGSCRARPMGCRPGPIRHGSCFGPAWARFLPCRAVLVPCQIVRASCQPDHREVVPSERALPPAIGTRLKATLDHTSAASVCTSMFPLSSRRKLLRWTLHARQFHIRLWSKDVNGYPIPETRRVKTLLGAGFWSYFISMGL